MTDDQVVLSALIVDDQELVRSGLSMILREKYGVIVVGECSDGNEVLAAVARYQPDVVVMDLRMKRVGGIEATRRLSQDGGPPMLALTTFQDDELLSGALRAGAGVRAAQFHVDIIPDMHVRHIPELSQHLPHRPATVHSRCLSQHDTGRCTPPAARAMTPWRRPSRRRRTRRPGR